MAGTTPRVCGGSREGIERRLQVEVPGGTYVEKRRERRAHPNRIRLAVATLAVVGAVGMTVVQAGPASANRSYHACFGTEFTAEEFAHAPGLPVEGEHVPVANGGCHE